MTYPKIVPHWIGGKKFFGPCRVFFEKFSPATGEKIADVFSGDMLEADIATSAASAAYAAWDGLGVFARAKILQKAAKFIESKKSKIADILALETGRPREDVLGEVSAAVECGYFFAGEGARYFGNTLPSANPKRLVYYQRESAGLALLITPFNNPLAAIAWKAFPALLCGNAVVLKSHEDVPYIGVLFAEILKKAGLPDGVFNVVQGHGYNLGTALTGDKRFALISFTGGVATGKIIEKAAAEQKSRFVKLSIEAGGKNPMIVCDDADLERAAASAVSSAFVDAGQRCAALSEIFIFDAVYAEFKKLFLEHTMSLRVKYSTAGRACPIINERRMNQILSDVARVVSSGAVLLAGGYRLSECHLKNGYFIAPTVLENVAPDSDFSKKEIFGPVVVLYAVRDFEEALKHASHSRYKLASAIHTKDINRAMEFTRRHKAGVVQINGPTHGSEPHMPFGGMELSGNGWREPGMAALDFYANWKQVRVDAF